MTLEQTAKQIAAIYNQALEEDSTAKSIWCYQSASSIMCGEIDKAVAKYGFNWSQLKKMVEDRL
jgi:predicted TPR repeat methyltransferase